MDMIFFTECATQNTINAKFKRKDLGKPLKCKVTWNGYF